MTYYEIDNKVYFNQSDLVEHLRNYDPEENQFVSDDFLMREGYMHDWYEEVEYTEDDLEYVETVSSSPDNHYELWRHSKTGTTLRVEVIQTRYFENAEIE
jgi:hypothetical protein